MVRGSRAPSQRRTKTESDPGPTRLLEAAAVVFANEGYEGARIREICAAAKVNVAAVNYHFGGKLGLYTAVLKKAMLADTDSALLNEVQHGASAETLLRLQISGMLREAYGRDSASVHIRLMTQELARPTAALDRVVDDVIRPRYALLRQSIGALVDLPSEHDKVRLCAHSIIGQVVHYVNAMPVISRVWPGLDLTPERIEEIAGHITDFSICALRAVAANQGRKQPKSKQYRGPNK